MSRDLQRYSDADVLVDAIISEVGKRIVLALPLGLGKANHVANALFARAVADPSINLKIFTALTLEKPRPSNDLERRFMGPIIERLFGGYPDLAYAKAMRTGSLPANIEVNEFFLLAGSWLGSPLAQQSYISANYTHALRYILDRGVNVVAQLVSSRGNGGGEQFNLSCNTDITLDLLKARAVGKADFLFVGEVNNELPFMPGEAIVSPSAFSHLLEGKSFPLFAPPKEPIGLSDYAIGLHVAGLVPDGGTLQIGIGSMGDAVAQGLILRHRENAAYEAAILQLTTQAALENKPFEAGLYGASEMLVDSFLDLMKAGVLKREVDGIVLHAGFFVGPTAFYQALRDMPSAELAKIGMSPISFINELYGDEEKKRRHRVGARFVNSAMMATLLGSVVSDGLEDGRVVSGVGGQYNFVSQAFALDDARSIITLRSTRESGGKTLSNIRWNYGHTTIPRHLRDIIVTEYGIADIRGKTDRDTIVAMLSVTDARFQDALLDDARKAGKIEKTFEIPAGFRRNTPSHIESALKSLSDAGLIPPFPFGTDLTETELLLMPALQTLKTASASPLKLARLLARGVMSSANLDRQQKCLSRVGLDKPKGFTQRIYATLLRGALA